MCERRREEGGGTLLMHAWPTTITLERGGTALQQKKRPALHFSHPENDLCCPHLFISNQSLLCNCCQSSQSNHLWAVWGPQPINLSPTRGGIWLKIIPSTLFELRISGHLEHEYVDQTRCVNLRTAVMRGRRSVKAPDNVPSADVFWHAGNHPDQPDWQHWREWWGS